VVPSIVQVLTFRTLDEWVMSAKTTRDEQRFAGNPRRIG